MSTAHTCPYCSHQLLRHARADGFYWRCTHCREEIPELYATLQGQLDSAISEAPAGPQIVRSSQKTAGQKALSQVSAGRLARLQSLKTQTLTVMQTRRSPVQRRIEPAIFHPTQN